MFHLLRRIVIVSGWLGLCGLAVCLYQYRHVFDPMVDLARSLNTGPGARQEVCGEMSGRAVRVFSGDTFLLQNSEGILFTVRLTGLSAPDLVSPNPAERLRARQSRTNLSELVLSNQIHVIITVSNSSRILLGLARAGTTHVNVRLVESGAAVMRRELMNGLPMKDRYALLRADRRAKSRELLPEHE